jgi:hypothetical protein
MDTAVNLILFVIAASFMTLNAWLMWQWEGRLVERGTLPNRRFLVRRGPESWRWPWQSWQRKWGLDSPDPDPQVEQLRSWILRTSKLADAALVITVLAWAYTGLRG